MKASNTLGESHSLFQRVLKEMKFHPFKTKFPFTLELGIADNKSLSFHFEPDSKCQNMKWRLAESPK